MLRLLMLLLSLELPSAVVAYFAIIIVDGVGYDAVVCCRWCRCYVVVVCLFVVVFDGVVRDVVVVIVVVGCGSAYDGFVSVGVGVVFIVDIAAVVVVVVVDVVVVVADVVAGGGCVGVAVIHVRIVVVVVVVVVVVGLVVGVYLWCM